MERAGKSLAKLKLSGKISTGELACAAWPEAVGRRVALHAQATALVRERLIVEVEDAEWGRQLYQLRWQILERLKEVLGEGFVRDVEFRVVQQRRPPQMATERTGRTADSNDEAEGITDGGLRIIYRQARKKASA
jgi:predicted nucleic acid-binding Zn ribbon protein